MFEIGWTEMLVIAIVMIVVVGPKDLPRMLRTFGKTVAKLRGMAGDFQKQFNEALKEAELDDVKKSIDDIRGLNPMNDIKKQLNPFEKAAADVRSGLDQAMKPSTADQPAVDAVHTAEPLKTGSVAMPAAVTPEAIASPPPGLMSASGAPVAGPQAPEPTANKRTAKSAVPAKSGGSSAAKAAPKSVAAAPKAAPKATAKATTVKAAPVSAKAIAPAIAHKEPSTISKPVVQTPVAPVAAKPRSPASKAKNGAANGVTRPGTPK